MMKYEFEKIYGKPVTEQEYQLIEVIYNDHPLVASKGDAVHFWKIGGALLFNDMLTTALKCRDIRGKIDCARRVQDRGKIEELHCIGRLTAIQNPQPMEVL